MFGKLTGVIGVVAAIVGAISVPEILNLLPANISASLVVVGSVVAALSRSLIDADQNGVPDIFDR